MANVIVRIPESLHAVARIASAARGKSLNAWILEAIRASVLNQARRKGGEAVAAALEADRKAETRA
jgi:plasmid stability protein